jgi:SAM-dependent methyltransferase
MSSTFRLFTQQNRWIVSFLGLLVACAHDSVDRRSSTKPEPAHPSPQRCHIASEPSTGAAGGTTQPACAVAPADDTSSASHATQRAASQEPATDDASPATRRAASQELARQDAAVASRLEATEDPPGAGHGSASAHASPDSEQPASAQRPGAREHRHGARGSHRHAHHGMARRFRNPRRWAKVFDGRRRDRWQRPDVVLSRLGLKPAMRVADIGAGTGYFAVRFGQALPRGRVWAIDVEAEMVTYLNARARKLALPQVAAIQGGLDDPRIPEPVDIVFLCNTYHHISNRVAYFRNVRQQVAPQGRLVIVDFRLGKIPVGPAEHHRTSPALVARELGAAGFEVVEIDRRSLPYQYIAIFRPAGTAKKAPPKG